MIRLIHLAALALLACPVMAAAQGAKIANLPSRVGATGIAIGDPDGAATTVSAANPLPIACASGCSGTPTGTAGSPNASVVTVQGAKGGQPQAILDLDQYSTALGRSFSVGTGIVSIPANNVLNVVYTCNAPTGSMCHVYARRFGNGSSTVLQYQNFRSPVAITGGTTKVAGNKLVGSANTSTSNITYITASTAISTGTAAITDFVYPANDTLIPYMTSLPPGGTVGVTISGASGALSGAVLASVLFIAYEGAL